jgi:GDP-4-dehydro-6-deoxy-D-mannose reductase
MKALITGITGFAGSHLAEFLLAEHPEVEISGTFRWRSPRVNIRPIEDKIQLVETELRDFTSVHQTLQKVQPDVIFHLAAQSYVPASWSSPGDTLSANILGQTHIFEAVRQLGLDPVIQIACSSEEYGLVKPEETPIKETNPLRPLSPYAVSKMGQDFLAYQYHQSYGLKTLRTRGFNHTGPRRGEVFVTSNFAKQLAEIKAGLAEPVMRVGNLDAIRDFTDVRDTVRGYWLAVQKGLPGEVYNICSGVGITIRELLDRLIALADVEVKIETDPDRLRPSDVEILIGDCAKFKAQTGWEPQIPFDQTLRDTFDYWYARVGGK